MKMIMLMVLFSTAADPAPHTEDGYYPRQMASMEKCLQHRSRLHSYLEAHTSGETRFKAFCVEFNAQGYSEAVDAFRRDIGDPA
ncbi:hypothetical protein PXK01_19485 [Phaeobacter sp. PT47_59]|uniref:hypothetical protein n=1 Tax=Phaeobacter sp. PT47_59 TaxID=3029979 RepID=UPI0023801F8F|nr:hypothetical protein [Phaeobacter sp. PT47_59]MDE4176344.1 hypothetical protein [Phaeobacter sp. PT47_59]